MASYLLAKKMYSKKLGKLVSQMPLNPSNPNPFETKKKSSHIPFYKVQKTVDALNVCIAALVKMSDCI